MVVCCGDIIDWVNVAVATSERCPFWALLSRSIVASIGSRSRGLETGPPLSLESCEQSAITELLDELDIEQPDVFF